LAHFATNKSSVLKETDFRPYLLKLAVLKGLCNLVDGFTQSV